MMRGLAYVDGVGVVERGCEGDGVDIADVGTVERFPEVVYGVKSRTSGKIRQTLFLDA
jgi:hypothetical protein